MKGSLIALDTWNGAKAAALVVDGRLDDLLMDASSKEPAPGTIFRAIADRVVKGQGGAFMRLPGGASGFLRQPGALKSGQPVLVQVTGYAEPGKAIPVTAKLLFKGRHAILTPGAPGVNLSRSIHDEARRDALLELVADIDLGACGAILRSGADAAEGDAILQELDVMLQIATPILQAATGTTPEHLLDGPDAQQLALRDWATPDDLDDEPGAFARHDIIEMIETCRAHRVDLPGSTTAYIEPTRALVAVDVNTGPDTSPAAGLKANIACARDLPRQLRCRGLGGQITIDFAPMPKRDRKQIEQALRTAFRGDAIETALVGWTPLGHYELQRKRERLPLF